LQICNELIAWLVVYFRSFSCYRATLLASAYHAGLALLVRFCQRDIVMLKLQLLSLTWYIFGDCWPFCCCLRIYVSHKARKVRWQPYVLYSRQTNRPKEVVNVCKGLEEISVMTLAW